MIGSESTLDHMGQTILYVLWEFWVMRALPPYHPEYSLNPSFLFSRGENLPICTNYASSFKKSFRTHFWTHIACVRRFDNMHMYAAITLQHIVCNLCTKQGKWITIINNRFIYLLRTIYFLVSSMLITGGLLETSVFLH